MEIFRTILVAHSCLAGTRPVFRGLRRVDLPVPGGPTRILAGTRPVFRGLRRVEGHPEGADLLPLHLQGRDPFSGDCDTVTTRSTGCPVRDSTCRDETRFQGIATKSPRIPYPGGRSACRDETRFQGIATCPSGPPGSAPMPSCRDETRFQGIATRLAKAVSVPWRLLAGTRPVFRGLRHDLPALLLPGNGEEPCRDETRFQGIATQDKEADDRISP